LERATKDELESDLTFIPTKQIREINLTKGKTDLGGVSFFLNTSSSQKCLFIDIKLKKVECPY
jgi:hypothetical protein